MSHITRLQAENIKKLKVIDVRPGTSAGVVPIRGRNAQGKSSTLDAIQMALGGAKFTPSRPIRSGEEEGTIRLELDTGEVILRRFTSTGGDTLEVTNGEGYKAGSPQALLNKLFASVAFDPLAFTRLKPAEQLANLRGMVKLDVDVDALERQVAADYEKRRDKNREKDREAARLQQMPKFPDAPAERVDEAALEEKIAQAAETNGQIERRRANREEFARSIERNKAAVPGMRDEIDATEQRLQALKVKLAEHLDLIAGQEMQLEQAEPLPDPVDVTQVQADLRAARDANAKVAAQAAHSVQALLVQTLTNEADALTKAIEARRAEIAAAIERAEMPVPGLGFGDGEVLFNGVPLDQASSAEQLRVSTAIGIASSPKLRVMLVRDGSLLDDEGEKILADMAAAHDFQLWVESVDTSGTVGFVLEDGAVVAIDGEAAPEPEEIAKPRRRAKKASEPAEQEIGQEPQKSANEAGELGQEEIGAAADQDGPVQPEADTAPWAEPEPEPKPEPIATPSLFD